MRAAHSLAASHPPPPPRHYASTEGAYDIAVLLSGDKDFMPALSRIRYKGKQARSPLLPAARCSARPPYFTALSSAPLTSAQLRSPHPTSALPQPTSTHPRPCPRPWAGGGLLDA